MSCILFYYVFYIFKCVLVLLCCESWTFLFVLHSQVWCKCFSSKVLNFLMFFFSYILLLYVLHFFLLCVLHFQMCFKSIMFLKKFGVICVVSLKFGISCVLFSMQWVSLLSPLILIHFEFVLSSLNIIRVYLQSQSIVVVMCQLKSILMM